MNKCTVLLRLDDGRGFLPEGIIAAPNLVPTGFGLPDDAMWFAFITIQLAASGVKSRYGLLHFFEIRTGAHVSIRLDERPGAVIPTNRRNVFLVPMGQGAALIQVDVARGRDFVWTGSYIRLQNAVFPDPRPGELANDSIGLGGFGRGMALIGTKNLPPRDKCTGGLYLWRYDRPMMVRLLGDQMISNGKALRMEGGELAMYDTDSPTQVIVRRRLNPKNGSLGPAKIVVDMRGQEGIVPDGCVLSPDGTSLLVAVFRWGGTGDGQVREYDLETGVVKNAWTFPGSQQVTCPALVRWFDGSVKLVVTTARENMNPETAARNPNSGAIFIADTKFKEATPPDILMLP